MLPELKYTKALLNRKEDLKKRLHSNKINSEKTQHIKDEISSIDDKVASLIKYLTPFINAIEDVLQNNEIYQKNALAYYSETLSKDKNYVLQNDIYEHLFGGG